MADDSDDPESWFPVTRPTTTPPAKPATQAPATTTPSAPTRTPATTTGDENPESWFTVTRPAAATTTPPEQRPAPMYQGVWGQPPGPTPDAVGGVTASDVARAAGEATYNAPNIFLTPKGEQWAATNWFGRNILLPVTQNVSGDIAGIGAGVGTALYGLGSAIGGPRLGADVNVLAQTAPIALGMGAYQTEMGAGKFAGVMEPEYQLRERIRAMRTPPGGGGGPPGGGGGAGGPPPPPAGPTWRPLEPDETLPPGTPQRTNPNTGGLETTAPYAPRPSPTPGGGPAPLVPSTTEGLNPKFRTAADRPSGWFNTQSLRDQLIAAGEDRATIGKMSHDELAQRFDDRVAQTPAPQAAGAQATPPGSIPTPDLRQRLQNLQTDLNQSAYDRAGPRMQDDTQYVPTVRGEAVPQRPLASRQFHPANSVDEKWAYKNDQMFRDQIDTINRERNNMFADLLHDDAGDRITLGNAYDARDAVSPDAMKVFEGETPTDASGLAQALRDQIASRTGRRDLVRGVLQRVLNSLYDNRNAETGNLITSPDLLYGARQNVTDLLKQGATGSGEGASAAQAAKEILQDILPQFDQVIQRGASAYTDYMREFHRLSLPIDQMEFLQNYLKGGTRSIYATDGTLLLGKVEGMLRDIFQGNQARGVNKAKSLTDEQIQNVVNVRNELAAEDLKRRMGAVPGSDTFQMLATEAQKMTSPAAAAARGATRMGVQTALRATPILRGIGKGIEEVWEPWKEARTQQEIAENIARRKRELLSQDPATDPEHPRNTNPYMPPPQPQPNPLQPPP